MLSARNIEVAFGGLKALRGVSLDAERGAIDAASLDATERAERMRDDLIERDRLRADAALRRFRAGADARRPANSGTLAERVASLCLADPRVVIVRVRVEKPDVIVEAGGVGVEIERRRPDASADEAAAFRPLPSVP